MNPVIIKKAPAKINLRLEVLSKREDGYHELQMIMLRLDFGDTLTLTESDTLKMSCDNPALPTDDSNLVMRAAKIFEEKAARPVRVNFDLKKRIPIAAGLGGGSSDAAAALIGLQEYYNTAFSNADLESMGMNLGADVPFFIRPGHKIAQGVGERLFPFSIDPELALVLINPQIAVSTREIYQKIRLTTPQKQNNLPPSLRGLRQATRLLRNDLEAVVLEKYPQVSLIKEFLKDSGCVGCMMSGSGPTVFGIFEDTQFLDRIAKSARDQGWKSWVTRTSPD